MEWNVDMWLIIGGGMVLCLATLVAYHRGYHDGFEAGEDHALPPRDPKGRFQKTK
jgi:hypothetical protein